MNFFLLTANEVIKIHDTVLNPGELEGMAGDKSLEGALSRVDFRVQYGMINDVCDLAAMYAVAISQAHVFNDANKRTAHSAMEYCLLVHDVNIYFITNEVGDMIIAVAQGKVDEQTLAAWLRQRVA